jgi:phosphoglycolate phosphatase-like HAD superfamily hydrolase
VSRPGILFDVDGTLVDTNYIHALAWSRALRDAGEWAPTNAIHRLIGMGGDLLVRRLIGHDCPAASAARPAHLRSLLADARPFPGAAELLGELHRQGVAVVLATSAPADELEALLEILGAGDGGDIGEAIDAVTTADDVEVPKPAPDVFHAAMQQGGLDPRRSLAVGDTVWDVRAARAAGIGCLAVETGGFSRHELAEAGALHVYRDVQELRDLIYTGPVATLLSAGAIPVESGGRRCRERS